MFWNDLINTNIGNIETSSNKRSYLFSTLEVLKVQINNNKYVVKK